MPFKNFESKKKWKEEYYKRPEVIERKKQVRKEYREKNKELIKEYERDYKRKKRQEIREKKRIN